MAKSEKSRSTGPCRYFRLLFDQIHQSPIALFLEKMSNLRELSRFVDLLPVTSETKNSIYNVMAKMLRVSSSDDAVGVIEELKHVKVIAENANSSDSSNDLLHIEAQSKLNELLDRFWLMIEEENATHMDEACRLVRDIFNGIFAILSQKTRQIEALENQLRIIQGAHDELLLGSVATQIIIKMSRFGRQSKEHPSVDACRTIEMILTQPNIEDLKLFLESRGYSFEDVRLAVHILKSSRIEAAHPSDPSTSSSDIQTAIDHLYPAQHPKRIYAQKALRVLELLSQESKETLFLQTNYR